jgi:transcriptional regulator with XRE-family HTH domain
MAELANRIDVPRATFTHIKSGRNKVSLELLEKLKHYDLNLDLEYIILGKRRNSDERTEDNNSPSSLSKDSKKKVERIMLFYSDLTFEEYKPGNR